MNEEMPWNMQQHAYIKRNRKKQTNFNMPIVSKRIVRRIPVLLTAVADAI